MPNINEQSIEIDCAPGTPRPNSYIKRVMTGSGVEYDGRAPVSAFFGCWKWDFSDVPAEVWAAAQPILAERLTELYNAGRIRYCSW